jgi:tetratricopeptide (TPR) repeat protein
MNCDDVAPNAVAEQYVAGQITDAEQDAYEAHYFECPHCLDDLRTLQAIRNSLSARTRAANQNTRPRWWSLAAAVLFAAALGWWWMNRAPARVEVRREPTTNIDPNAGRYARYDQLARIEPSPYTESRFRGASEAEMKFRAAMRLYAQNDFTGAVPGLAGAAHLDPQSSAIRFYLGLSELLTGKDADGERDLRLVAAKEDALQAGDAHYYLGLALLKKHDADAALGELRRAIASQSASSADAQRLIAAIQAVEGKSGQ